MNSMESKSGSILAQNSSQLAADKPWPAPWLKSTYAEARLVSVAK